MSIIAPFAVLFLLGILAGTGTVRQVVGYLVEGFKWLVAELRILRHRFFGLLAKWLENDFAWMVLVAATICMSIVWPKIVKWVGELTITLVLRQFFEQLKENVAMISESIHLIDLVTINTMVKLVWPEYRALMADFANMVGALAEELGEGSGYIHAYFGVVHGLAATGAAYLDLDGEVSQMQAFQDTDEFLTNVDERFDRYAHNPGLIVRDIIDEIYIPYANEVRDGQQAVISELQVHYDYLLNTTKAVAFLEGNLDHFIAIQPEEMAAIIEERLGPIQQAFADLVTYMETTILPPIDESIDALEYRAEVLEAASLNAAERLEDPATIMSAYLYYPEEMQESFEDLVARIAAAGEGEDIEASLPALDTLSQAMIEATKDRYEEAEPVVQPSRAALAFEMPGTPSPGAIRGWFQGEY